MIFLRRLAGGVVPLELSASATLGDLSAAIYDLDGLLPADQSLLLNQKPLCGAPASFLSDAPAFSPFCTVTVLARLRGGKGGFGARLRSMAGKVGAKKTTNFSACRDLSGRRLRHVEAERALRKWIADDNHADPAEVAEKFAAIQHGGRGKVDAPRRACRFGAGCTERGAGCNREHPQDAEERAQSQTRRAELTALGSRFGQDTGKEALGDVGSAEKAVIAGSVAEGLRAALRHAAAVPASVKPAAAAKPVPAPAAAGAEAAPAAPAAAAPASSLAIKGAMFGLGLDLSSDDEDDDDGGDGDDNDGAGK
jgi:hypothetical protein